MDNKQQGNLPEFIYVRFIGEGEDGYFLASPDVTEVAPEGEESWPLGKYKLTDAGRIWQTTTTVYQLDPVDAA